jgi:polysaccharide lyase-like protein/Big-like domain-containing protein
MFNLRIPAALALMLLGVVGFALPVAFASSSKSLQNCHPNKNRPCPTTTTTTTTTPTSSTTTGTTTTTTTTTTTPTTTTTTVSAPPAYGSSDPASGTTLSGTVTWTVQTSGDVASVEFWMDNQRLATDTSSPWSTSLDTTKYANGAHNVGLALVAADGTRVTPQVGTFTFSNTVAPASTTTTTTTSTTTTASSSPSGKVYFRGDYETGNLSQWHGPQLTTSASAQAETAVARAGRYAASFTTPAGTSRQRSQVYADQAQTDGYSGEEVWYAWSMYIAPGSSFEQNSAWNNLTSWHHTGSSCPAPDHFEVDTTTGAWTLHWSSWGGPLDTTNCSNPYRKSWNFGTLQAGHWYDFVAHIKWSDDPSIGFVEFFLDGKKLLPLTHAATLYTGQGVYLKQGFDTGGANGPTTIYNDGTVIASDYATAVTAFPSGTWPTSPPS